MRDFTVELAPSRVVFGWGTRAAVPAEVAALGRRRALVVSTPELAGLAREVAAALGERAVGVFAEARMHTPVETTEAAAALLRERGADVLVAVGGGSSIGLGKALAARTGLDQVVLPTTYAGSEMTPILGETEGGRKTTRRAPAILPEVVVYDVELTLTLPARLSAASGLNAVAHAVEALYARDGNPIHALMAEEAVRALAAALPRIAADSGDRDARSDALYGAWLAGACLGAVGMALHHKLCHVLGGAFGLPHAETHAAVLPHALAFNAPAAPAAAAALSRALGGGDPAAALHGLGARLGAPAALRDLGFPEAGIAEAADLALADPYWNPRPVDREALLGLLGRAWRGAAPLA